MLSVFNFLIIWFSDRVFRSVFCFLIRVCELVDGTLLSIFRQDSRKPIYLILNKSVIVTIKNMEQLQPR